MQAQTTRRTAILGGLGLATTATLTLGAPAANATATQLPLDRGTMPAGLPLLKRGSRGWAVTQLQRDLNTYGYWVGSPDGVFGHLTQQAVWAVQKRAGLVRDGVVGPKTRYAIAHAGRLRPLGSGYGTRVEIWRGRQLLLIVRDGRTRWMINTSTGNGEYYYLNGRRYKAVTPAGTYSVYSTYSSGWQPGPLGPLYRPQYFRGGIAVHGSESIPTYPASHGCCRVSVGAMDMFWKYGLMRMGTRVQVF